MKTKTFILILLVVVLPTSLLSWGGYQIAKQQSGQIEDQVKSLLRDQLVEIDKRVKRYFSLQEANLQKISSIEFATLDSIREAVDSNGIIDNIFIITRNGTLAYPNPHSPLNQRELEFYTKIRTLVEDGDIQNEVLRQLNANNPGNTTNFTNTISQPPAVNQPFQPTLPQNNSDENQQSTAQYGSPDSIPQTSRLPQNAQELNPQQLIPQTSDTEEQEPGGQENSQPQTNRSQSNQPQSAQQGESRQRGASQRGISQRETRQGRKPQDQQQLAQQADSQNDLDDSISKKIDFIQNSFPNLSQWKTQPDKFQTCAGWFVWYWGRGLNLIYWNRNANGNIVCISLSRPRWMSDLVVELPESTISSENDITQTNFADEENEGHNVDALKPMEARTTRIVNAKNEVVYQWGATDDGLVLAAELPASTPLNAWTLQLLVPPEELEGKTTLGLNILMGIVASSLALIAVAVVFVREYTKELGEAKKRVSFVNQVSHELRTPLTNIRMYAELLGKDLDRIEPDDSEKANQRLQVIDAESERLSRLIGNVLSFAGSQKNGLKLHYKTGVIDDSVESVISSFSPNLQKLNLKIKTELDAKAEVRFDSDMLEQILGNLISNVEKYASQGEFIRITTLQNDESTEIRVEDDGDGVPAQYIQKIFEPFWRMSNELQQASGTGIGLSISRELARLHGGDLTLETNTGGACFLIKLKTEKV